jgi:hypothetical protein
MHENHHTKKKTKNKTKTKQKQNKEKTTTQAKTEDLLGGQQTSSDATAAGSRANANPKARFP